MGHGRKLAMPAIASLCLAFALGAGLSQALERDGRHCTVASATLWRAAMVAAILGALVAAPGALLVATQAPDWMLGYWLSAAELPLWLSGFWALAHVILPAAALVWLSRCPPVVRRLGVGGGLAMALLIILPFWARLSVQATVAQVRGDFGVLPLMEGTLGPALLWLMGFVIAGFGWAFRAVRFLCST